MTDLAIEISSRLGSVAVKSRGRSVEVLLEGERRHASDLLPRLERLLSDVGADISEVSSVVVGTGPGSFTGLRVGIATAFGLVRATGAQLRGVASFEALALAELEDAEEGICLRDARGGAFYLARYRRWAGEIEVLRAPCVVDAQGLGALLEGDGPILGEEGIARAARLEGDALERLRIGSFPRAGPLLELGRRRIERDGPHRPEEVEPLYLRPFAARKRGSGR